MFVIVFDFPETFHFSLFSLMFSKFEDFCLCPVYNVLAIEMQGQLMTTNTWQIAIGESK